MRREEVAFTKLPIHFAQNDYPMCESASFKSTLRISISSKNSHLVQKTCCKNSLSSRSKQSLHKLLNGKNDFAEVFKNLARLAHPNNYVGNLSNVQCCKKY